MSIEIAKSLERARTRRVAERALLSLLLALGSTLAAWAGGQGVGLTTPPPVPDDVRVRTWLMNEPGEAPPKLVCVDEPTTSCFDLVLEQPDPTFPTRVWSPDCPPGPALRNCRADEIPGTSALTGRFSIAMTPANQWTATDVSQLHAFDGDCSGGIGTLGSISTPSGYAESFDPSPGSAPYADNFFVSLFAPIPAALGCASWIQTRTSDANGSAAAHLGFTVKDLESYVYVLYENGAQAPSWLTSAFAQTASTVTTDLGTLRVWRSNALFAPGAGVTLGGNHAGGGNAAQMYLVVVRPPDALELCGSYTASATLERPGLSTPVQSFTEQSCYHQAGPDREFLTPKPLELGGGIGFLVRGALPLSCSQLPFGERLELERSFGPADFISRGALRRAGELSLPAQLCVPNASGKCTLKTSVALMEPTGELATGTPSGNACSFPIDFTPRGQTRAVVYGGAGFSVDSNPATQLDAFSSDRGIVKDVDVVLNVSYSGADEVRSTLVKGATLRALDGRAGCSTFNAGTEVVFDDAAASVATACGTLTGRWKPNQPLNLLNNTALFGLWSLRLLDVTNPGNFTAVNDWQLRIQTSLTGCSDGLDNDGDGKTDWDGAGIGAADPQCTSPTGSLESPPVAGGCGIGPELAPLLLGLAALRRRRR
ncbi:MAG: hypothetical protein ACHQ6V_03995 [Myxococcota bacterium]